MENRIKYAVFILIVTILTLPLVVHAALLDGKIWVLPVTLLYLVLWHWYFKTERILQRKEGDWDERHFMYDTCLDTWIASHVFVVLISIMFWVVFITKSIRMNNFSYIEALSNTGAGDFCWMLVFVMLLLLVQLLGGIKNR